MTETVATPEPEPAVDDLARHAQKMAKKKAARDRIMAGKEGEKGLIIVHTGAGKGKSSSGFGMILRCVAHGMPCAVVQFIKGAWDTGERRLITTHFSDLCQFHAMGEGFTWETQDPERDAAAARAAWETALRYLRDPAIGLVVLDEMTYAFKYRWLPLDEVLAAFAARPAAQHVIVTGRAAPDELIAAADTVTEMLMVKHAFKAGVKAMPGMEF